MRVKCEYCESWVDDTEERCPSCGAPNKAYTRMADGNPKTIQQLRQWYQDRGLPPEQVTRFFIGKDTHEPKAFGIYQDGENFVVYKNKTDGSRAVRYRGKDEAYAVHEIHTKLKEEILNQRARQSAGRPGGPSYSTKRAESAHSYQSASEKAGSGCLNSTLGRIILGVLTLGGFVSNFEVAPLLTVLLVLLPFAGLLVARLLFKNSNEDLWKTIKTWFIRLILVYLVVAMIAVSSAYDVGSSSSSSTATPTYYSYNDTVYCGYGDDYYYYNGTDYEPVYDSYVIGELDDHGDDYIFDSSYVDWDGDYSFYDSDYYDDYIYTPSYSSSNSSYSSSYSSSDSSSDSFWDWDSSSSSSSSSWDSSSSSSSWDSSWSSSSWDSDW